MTINLQAPDIRELKPRITVFGCGGAGGNAVNNMIEAGLMGCDFVVANTDAQALSTSKAERRIQMGIEVTQGLGAGAQPEVGRAAAEEVIDEIRDQIAGAHMLFITGGMGGGTGTGSSPVVARAARDLGILTVGVVTKPFHFEGARRMRLAEAGIAELQKSVDTLIVIPNQNLFRVANEKTTFADAFAMADQVLYSGVASVTDLMVKEGLINLDFADVRAVMREMGKAMMGTGEATGEGRALAAAEAAISNPLLDETSMRGARGLLISISGGSDLTLYEIDEAANRIRQEVDEEANVIFGATRDESLEGIIRVSVVATGIDQIAGERQPDVEMERRIAEVNERFTAVTRQRQVDPVRIATAAPRRFTPVVETGAPTGYDAVRSEPEAMPQAAPEPVYQAPVQPAPAPLEEPAMRPAAVQAAPVQGLAPAPLPHALDPYEAFAQPVPPASEPVPSDAPFIPPQPERVVRAPRMPRVEELPMPAQRQMQAAPAPQGANSPVEAKRMTLLQRLAAVGMGRKDEGGETAAPEAPRATVAPQPSAVHAEYGRRPAAPQPVRSAQGQLDVHGRPQPTNRALDDDHLEIPAFLRRQAN